MENKDVWENSENVNVNRSPSPTDGGHNARNILVENVPLPSICVICLERIDSQINALPCKHDQFHLSCLGTWLQQSHECPLCKGTIRAISYRDDGEAQISYHPFHDEAGGMTNVRRSDCHQSRRMRRLRHNNTPGLHVGPDDQLNTFRRQIYNQRKYSLYVGSNKFNGYRNITCQDIGRNETLIAKAKRWIRRELAVFDFLKPDSTAFSRTDRRATNSEYLLEYIVAIIKVIDIRGSGGQALVLLKDYLGAENASLFLHELENWLRSPFETLQDWDNNVQYAE